MDDVSVEERRERLRALARERMARLVAGEDVGSHSPNPDLAPMLSQEAAEQTGVDLRNDGEVEFRIKAFHVRIERRGNFREKGRLIHFHAIAINGFELDDTLIAPEGASEGTRFGCKVPEDLQPLMPDEFIFARNPYNLLYRLVGDPAFPSYFNVMLEEQKKRADLLEAARQRVLTEANAFKDVLVRKYRQLAHVDEYQTLDESAFLAEAKRFASRRLQDLPTEFVVEIVIDFVRELALESAPEEAEFAPSMSPLDYERLCASRFERAGWTVRLTKASGDQGADVICERDGRRAVVQCKLYGSPVGNDAVQQAIAAREFEFADIAFVVSNASYTPAARQLAAVTGVRLLHHDEIAQVALG